MKSSEDSVLITGSAGFIGFHAARRLLRDGSRVIGVDNINPYYDPQLKRDRLSLLAAQQRFSFFEGDISDNGFLTEIFDEHCPNVVLNFAAQAGVRYSLVNPSAYVQSNLVGFANVLEACRAHPVKHLVYASSSSVYGGNKKVPFEEADRVDHPVSFYAATKKANELMAESYAHLYRIPTTGLRFFTVYGPFGRPDMAYYSFPNHHFAGEAIRVFNNGEVEKDLTRDFTYVDDVVESLVRLLPNAPVGESLHRVLNIGGSRPEKLTDFISGLEAAFGEALHQPLEFRKVFEPQKPGDVPATFADADRLESITGFRPQVPLREGLMKFARWYVTYHRDTIENSRSNGQVPGMQADRSMGK